jgi:hypothetical protein
MNYKRKCIERKINNLIHNLEYYKKVYPGSSKIHKLQCQIYYYNKKLASLND